MPTFVFYIINSLTFEIWSHFWAFWFTNFIYLCFPFGFAGQCYKDARFQAMYTSHLFNLDPSDPNFKKTKATEKILEEKARQREQKEQELTQAVKKKESEIQKESHKRSVDPALSLLIIKT